jgi:hypothetical protein
MYFVYWNTSRVYSHFIACAQHYPCHRTDSKPAPELRRIEGNLSPIMAYMGNMDPFSLFHVVVVLVQVTAREHDTPGGYVV